MIEYAGRNLEWRQDFVKSIRAIPYAELVVLRDIDRCTCIPGKKKEVRDELRCAESDVFVVVQEIEGWYLAGASDALCRDLGINQPRTTHHVTKEKLKRLCPGEYSTLGEYGVVFGIPSESPRGQERIEISRLVSSDGSSSSAGAR